MATWLGVVAVAAVLGVGCSDGPDERLGVFVDGDRGQDNNPGTRDAPLKTVLRGVELASQLGKRVYVCSASAAYTEAVVATSDSMNGIHGGWSCGDWAFSLRRFLPIYLTLPWRRFLMPCAITRKISVRSTTILKSIECLKN